MALNNLSCADVPLSKYFPFNRLYLQYLQHGGVLWQRHQFTACIYRGIWASRTHRGPFVDRVGSFEDLLLGRHLPHENNKGSSPLTPNIYSGQITFVA